jgi:hypothetical protein
MMDLNPAARPSASQLKETFGSGQDCCFMAPEPFEASDREPAVMPYEGFI